MLWQAERSYSFLGLNNIPLCICTADSNPSIDGRLGYLHVFIIVKNTAIAGAAAH